MGVGVGGGGKRGDWRLMCVSVEVAKGSGVG